jgi:F-type H+-transporting ATPase subunit gamma
MAVSEREMRLRIRSVKNISQVTRALEAVSAARVRKAQQAVNASRAYAGRAFEVLQNLAKQGGSGQALHPLLTQRANVQAITVVLVSSDRGLAGAYNMNVARAAWQFAAKQTVPVKYVTIGRKGRDLTLRLGGKVVADFDNFRGSPTFVEVTPIAQLLLDEFNTGKTDQVYLAYTDFVSPARQVARVRQLLPLSTTAEGQAMAEYIDAGDGKKAATEYIYEPNPVELLNTILPRFTQVQVYQAVLESLASEHSARMVAMRNATDNAKELANGLRLAYNKARQLGITSELLDIAGGVEALRHAHK